MRENGQGKVPNMAYTYQADVWCDKCAAHIIGELQRNGTAPSDTEDETSFDSDDYPKRYWPDSEEADGPQNCASGNCGGGPSDGFGAYGTFLENGLTTDGYEYLKSMLDGHGKTLPAFAQEWADFYQFTYHDNPWSIAHEWLLDTVRDHAASIQDTDGGKTHSMALVSIVNDLVSSLDADTIQDHFQSEMDDDGFFKESGWYSPEME